MIHIYRYIYFSFFQRRERGGEGESRARFPQAHGRAAKRRQEKGKLACEKN
jgi:hypothetical protein